MPSWRDVLKIQPACELFPAMPADGGSLLPANRSMNLEHYDRASIRLPSAAAAHEASIHGAAVSRRPNILAVDIRLR
jgi:hypothetical protein